MRTKTISSATDKVSIGVMDYITNYIQSKDEVYSLEDIKLAQELVRRIPEMKKWISRLQPFYLDTMPFVPDEYKN